MNNFFAQLRNSLVALALIILGTVVLAGPPVAHANGQETCNSAGYTKDGNEDKESGSGTYVWGTMSWAAGEIDYTVSDGFRVAFCIKQGTGVHESGWRTGSDTFDSGADDMSHVGYRFETRAPNPSVAMHDECGTANDSGPTFDEDTTHWTAAEGAGDTVVFTAKAGWYFPAAGDHVSDDGYTWTETFTPNTNLACEEDDPIPVTPTVSMVNECGTANDSGPTYAAETEHWTAVVVGNTVVFTANEGWFFPAGENVSEDGSTWTESYTPNTDVPCELPLQPDPEPRHQELEACAFDPEIHGDFAAGMIERDGTEAFVWDETDEKWVLSGTIVWGAWTQQEVWDDEEYFANNCALPRPASVTVDDQMSGCDLTEFGAFDAGTIRRTGEREYVWSLAGRAWELESMDDVSWADWTQAAEEVLTDEEYFEDCATGQPGAELRQLSGSEDSCPLAGTLVWTETYTTEYVWDTELRAWVLGEEGDPVREEELREWSQEKFERLCEVAGVQGEVQVMDHELESEVEVKGVQETAPPTSVDAGLGATPFSPVGAQRNPLALVALGGGLLLLGAAARRKKATAVR